MRVIQPIMPRSKRKNRFPNMNLMNGVSSLKKVCPKKMVFNEKNTREAAAPMIVELAKIWFKWMIKIISNENVVKRNFSSRVINSSMLLKRCGGFISYRSLLASSCPSQCTVEFK